jgi:hypothetical protein
VAVLPEAAGIIYGGGFPRKAEGPARRAAQRCIFHVERELERLAIEERQAAVVLCDRGTIDGLAYWPGSPEEYFADLGTTRETELARYQAVIHLRTPVADYNRSNPLRVESAAEARRIDARIEAAWAGHPRRFFVESTDDFLAKVSRSITLIRAELPDCCQVHPVDLVSTVGA